MSRYLLGVAVLLVLLLLSCGGVSSLDSMPATPAPDKGPVVSSSAALRPYYQIGNQAPAAAGTAFIVEDKAKRFYMLTAAHVMDDDAEWQRVQAVSLRPVGGNEIVAKVQGRPVHIGKAFDVANAGTDVVIWPLAADAKVTPLKLAADNPKRNEWVWALGQEPGRSDAQKMYRCKVTGTEAGGLTLDQHDRFEMRGFSGGPIVNAQGEVVGSLLGGRAPKVLSCGVSSIRQRLAEAKIDVP
jgi:S1-C subfamily serine protease